MRISTLLALPIAILSVPVMANTDKTNPEIDYRSFAELTVSLEEVRSQRLLNREDFLTKARAEGALLLDTRSADAFQWGHIEGAVNLPFSDFTSEKLAKIIGPDMNRPIYIYCNNNFSDNIIPIPLKFAPLALNIPTFINLHGYGYTNIWELGELTSLSNVPWVSDMFKGDQAEDAPAN